MRVQRRQLQPAHEEEPPGLRAQRQPAGLSQQRLLRRRVVRRGMRQRKSLLFTVRRLQGEVLSPEEQN